MERRKAVEEDCADGGEKRERDVEAGQLSLSGNVSFFFPLLSRLMTVGNKTPPTGQRQGLNQCSTYLRSRLSVSEAEPQGKKRRKN